MRFGRVARVYLAANSGFARLRPTSMTTPKHLYFACLIVAAPGVDDPSCNALQPCTTPGTPQMSLAGTGSLHDRQEDVLARNERGIFIRSVEIHDPANASTAAISAGNMRTWTGSFTVPPTRPGGGAIVSSF